MKRKGAFKRSAQQEEQWSLTCAMDERSGNSGRHTYKALSNFTIKLELEYADGCSETADLSSRDLGHLSKLGITVARTAAPGNSVSSKRVKALGPTSMSAISSCGPAKARRQLQMRTGELGLGATVPLNGINPSSDSKEMHRKYTGCPAPLVQASLVLSERLSAPAHTGECQDLSGSKDMMETQVSSSTMLTDLTSRLVNGSDSSTVTPSKLNSKVDQPTLKRERSGSPVARTQSYSSMASASLSASSSSDESCTESAADLLGLATSGNVMTDNSDKDLWKEYEEEQVAWEQEELQESDNESPPPSPPPVTKHGEEIIVLDDDGDWCPALPSYQEFD